MKVSIPHMGKYSEVIMKQLGEYLGWEIVMPPMPSDKTIELGSKHMAELMCLDGDARVTLDDYTTKSIKEIQIGERVLTHKGRFRAVTKTFSRNYNGRLLTINCGGLLKLKITPEHPVLSLKRDQITCHRVGKQLPIICNPNKRSYYCQHRTQDCKLKRGLINFVPQFSPAGQLKKGDFVAIPIPKQENHILALKWTENYNGHSFKYRNENFPYISETLRLLGYYMAEGSICYNRRKTINPSGVAFSFSALEENYIHDVSNILTKNFTCTPSINKLSPTSVNLLVFGKALANMFIHLCGQYCHAKKVHKELMELSPNLQLELVKGFFRGDGHFDIKESNYSVATTSRALAEQCFWFFMRNSIKPSFHKCQQLNKKPYYVLKLTSAADINCIEEGLSTKRYGRYPSYSFITDDYIFILIRNIEDKDFNGCVYNLEVKDDNSFVANFLTVHNCLPAKVTLGTMIEACEMGVDHLLMFDSCGTCRLKTYWILQERALRKLGYNVKVHPMRLGKGAPYDIRAVDPSIPFWKAWWAFIKVLREVYRIDKKMWVEVPEESRMVKIGIVGEIFSILEPAINKNLIQKVEKMGALVHNSLPLSYFIFKGFYNRGWMKRRGVDRQAFLAARRKAHEYFPKEIGGHGIESIVHSIYYGMKGFDGVIHVEPFACMPESTVAAIVDDIGHDYNIPVMRLIFDAHTGETGLNTRLEAFVDILQRKKQRRR